MPFGLHSIVARLDELLVGQANLAARLAILNAKIGELMTSNEVTQASLDAEGAAVTQLDANIKTYVDGLQTAFNHVVDAWNAEKANGLTSANLDTAITNAQNDIAALPAVTDPTAAPPAPAPTPSTGS